MSETAVIKGISQAVSWVKKNHEKHKKSLEHAIRVEAFRLRKKLQSDIKSGSPGGTTLPGLSYIAQRHSRQIKIWGGATQRLNPNRKPLERLRFGVFYRVEQQQPFTMSVGWVDPGKGRHKTSKSWQYLATMHQRGFSREITPKQRAWVIRRGGELGKIEGGNTPFFLKRSTRKFKTPQRKILEPFWTANKWTANENIKRNYKRKLAGERI